MTDKIHMNKYFAFLLLMTCIGSTAYAQYNAPAPLFEAAHCLVTEKHAWLDLQKTKELSLGFRSDEKTMLGDKYLYVIVYTTPKRNEGRIFDIRIKKQDRQRVYNIENTATFVTTAKGVDFPQPPTGGTWAQNQLVTAIQQIEHHKWYVASIGSLQKESKHVQCASTADDQ